MVSAFGHGSGVGLGLVASGEMESVEGTDWFVFPCDAIGVLEHPIRMAVVRIKVGIGKYFCSIGVPWLSDLQLGFLNVFREARLF
jgi:hypothetical protein